MCSYLVQDILQCFYKNMHLLIVLCCGMKTSKITTIDCEFHKIVSLLPIMMCVSVPFSKLHEYACPYCFSCWYKGFFYKQTMAMLFIAVPSFMCVNCSLVHSTLAHFPLFFVVVCTQVHCLLMKTMSSTKNFRILLSMSIYRLYPCCIKCGEC